MFGLHHSVPPDYLHTFLKGFAEYCLAGVMSILYSVQTIYSSRYSTNVSTLDRRIESAYIDQTLPATRMSRFHGEYQSFFPQPTAKLRAIQAS